MGGQSSKEAELKEQAAEMKMQLSKQQQQLASYEAESRALHQIEEERGAGSMRCSDGTNRPRLLSNLIANAGGKFGKASRNQSKESVDTGMTSNYSTASRTSSRSFMRDLASDTFGRRSNRAAMACSHMGPPAAVQKQSRPVRATPPMSNSTLGRL